MKHKMNDKAHMHVIEAVIVVILILANIYFLISTISTPTVRYSTSLYQMESIGEDALKSADQIKSSNGLSIVKNSTIHAIENGKFTENDELISHLDEVLTKKISYRLLINNNVYYETGIPGNSTVAAHRIVFDADTGNIYDLQLLMWRKL